MHWPAPVVSSAVEHDAGPVMVTIEYHVDSQKRGEFLDAIERMSRARRRDGAYAWGIFEDVANPGRFVETFVVESWLEHLRQHERVTNADRLLEERLRSLLRAEPVIRHLIAPA
jgi:quinol monooxygenase YgiN